MKTCLITNLLGRCRSLPKLFFRNKSQVIRQCPSVYDFKGDGKVDGFYIGDLVR